MARAAKKVKAAPVVTVSQDEIAAINAKGLEVDALAKKLTALKKDLEEAEGNLLAKLQNGAHVEAGKFIAAIDKAPGRCNPKWKDEAILLAVQNGQSPGLYEETVKAKYPPKLIESLIITKIE